MSLIKSMEKVGKNYFHALTDKMVEHVSASLQSAITYTLRKNQELDLGLLTFTSTVQGEGEAAAIIPSVSLDDKFVKFVSDDDIVFDEVFYKDLKALVQPTVTGDFREAFKELLEGMAYDSDKNKIVASTADSASSTDIFEDQMSALVATFFGAIIEDLNANKASEKYTVSVLDILDVNAQVTSGKTKVSAAPNKALRQLVKDDLSK